MDGLRLASRVRACMVQKAFIKPSRKQECPPPFNPVLEAEPTGTKPWTLMIY